MNEAGSVVAAAQSATCLNCGAPVTAAFCGRCGQKVRIHGWCYGVHDGLLQDLRLSVDGSKPLDAIYKAAVQRIRHKWGKPAEPLVIPPRPRAESVVRTPPPAPTAQPTLEAPAAVGSSQDHVSPAP